MQYLPTITLHMGNMEGRQRISKWLKEHLEGLGWDQIDLANASGIGKSSVNKLWLGTQDLTIEIAEKLARVSALHASREELIDVFLGKELTTKQKRLRQAALEQFDRLSYNQQEMALHLLTALERGERK